MHKDDVKEKAIGRYYSLNRGQSQNLVGEKVEIFADGAVYGYEIAKKELQNVQDTQRDGASINHPTRQAVFTSTTTSPVV